MFSRVTRAAFKGVRRFADLVNVNEITQKLPSNMRGATKKAIKEVKENEELKQSKSRFNQRFLSFLLGIVVSGGIAGYYLGLNINKTSNELESNIQLLPGDIAHELNDFEAKLVEVENKYKH